jgi:uncharacterized protein with PIN domain
MESEPALICDRCKLELQLMEAQFTYLKRSFRHKILRCPGCGQVYVPEELARGRIREVERTLEDK